jgi:type I restriction enzyme S subunit
MKLETFFEKFDQFADAPNAVEKLRELVLRMATSGRIAEQDPADQPGSDLLNEIFAVRDNLIKRGAAKSRVEGNPITAGDTIDLPPSWARCMISEVCDLQTGATPSRAEHSYFGGDTPWLVSGDINKGEITECAGRITEEGLENSNCKIIPANSVLIALNGQGKTRATVAVLRISAALNQSLVAMIPYSGERLLPEYIFWNLRGRYYAIRDITGQDQRRGLNMKLVGQLSIPIPPIAEQKRIVAKVDELMALCDRLEAQQQERETRHAALARASLARFADAPTPANLPFLFHPSYAIPPADLRKSILTLAVQGKLVPQDPNDEPAGTDSECESQFDIPSNWRWTLVGRLGLCRTGKTPPTGDPTNYGFGFPFIGPGQITLSGRFTASEKSITRQGLENSTEANAGDILMVCIGGSIGKAAICREPIGFNQQINSVRLQRDLPTFVYLAVTADYFQEQVLANASGSATPIINKGKWEQIPIPLPPLAEQRRIVAKVEQLMALVDALETQLAASRATAANLLSALVAELTGTPNDGKVSIPSTSTTGRRGRPRKL